MFYQLSSNRSAFLTTIAISEGTENIGDHGYNALVGGLTFNSYADHPRILVQVNPHLKSTAAGRYQILEYIFDAYAKLLGLHDFTPASQDQIALQLISERHGLAPLDVGDFVNAVYCVNHIWASLPGAGYGQRENSIAALQTAYLAAGGVVSDNGAAFV
jgi:muramidase (phage lysozyme)